MDLHVATLISFLCHTQFSLPPTALCDIAVALTPTIARNLPQAPLRPGPAPTMTPSRVKVKDAQSECPLFKLAPETRNEIYALVFAVKTQEDGSVELANFTTDNALTRTCQQIYDESHKMYQSTSRDYPSNTFTFDVLDRMDALASIPHVSMHFFDQMTSFRVNWRADEHNQGKPLHFTTHFKKEGPRCRCWSVRVELHDEFWLGERAVENIVSSFGIIGTQEMCGQLSFASRPSCAFRGGPSIREDLIWQGMSSVGVRRRAIPGMNADAARLASEHR
jgi:hypothetical protein